MSSSVTNSTEISGVTLLLNRWSTGDEHCGNLLKEKLYFHIKDLSLHQIKRKQSFNEKNHLVEVLPNATSLLHDVLMALPIPDEYIENQRQYYHTLALFIRRTLLDELKNQNALKRGGNIEKVSLTTLLFQGEENHAYLFFDDAWR